MIRCPRCNTELPDGVSFCDACGAPVRGQMPPASPVYQPLTPGPAPGMAPTSQVVCPVCGTQAIAGEAYCDNCGASLLTPAGSTAAYPSTPPFAGPPAPAPATPPPFAGPPAPAPPFAGLPGATPPYGSPAPTPAPAGTHSARLVVTSSRAELPLPTRDDIILGREDSQSNSYPDVDFNPHGGLEQGVSRRHARITQRGGQFFLEDLNSVNGTLLNQRRIPANSPLPLRSGDHVMLGRLGMTFELI